MTILQITTDVAGEIDVNPRIVKILSTASLEAVTTPGYLNSLTLQSYTIYPTDIVLMRYNMTANGSLVLGAGDINYFVPVFNGSGVITLNTLIASALLPVVNNHIALFNGTTGQVKDSGSLIIAGTQSANFGGDNVGHIDIDGVTSDSNVQAAIVSTSNSNIFLQLVTPGDNQLTLAFNQAPGTLVVNYVVFNITLP